MTPIFVVLTNGLDVPTRNNVHEFVKTNSQGWWHRFPDVWMVRGQTPTYWRDRLKEIIRAGTGDSVLVLQLSNTTPGPGWASWSTETDLTDWLKTHFRKD